jgi:hypothetical protein
MTWLVIFLSFSSVPVNKSISETAIFQHLNFAETFAVAPPGVRFKFADASGIRSNLPQLS